MSLDPGGAVGASEQRLRRLLEETTLLAAITDDHDRIIYANAALARLVGKSPAEVVGSRWTGTFGSSPADDKFMNDLREGRVTSTYEGRILSVDGPRIIAWTNTLISGPPDSVAVASLGEDVTARRHAEEELLVVQAERLRLQQAILAAETAERARLAEALHDDTIQVITAALLNLDRMTCDNLDGMRRQTAAALTSALERARRLLFELRPPALDRGGLHAAIGDLGRQAAEQASQQLDRVPHCMTVDDHRRCGHCDADEGEQRHRDWQPNRLADHLGALRLGKSGEVRDVQRQGRPVAEVSRQSGPEQRPEMPLALLQLGRGREHVGNPAARAQAPHEQRNRPTQQQRSGHEALKLADALHPAQDDPQLDDQVCRSDLERHGRGEVAAFDEDRPCERHRSVGAGGRCRAEAGRYGDRPWTVIGQQSAHLAV